MILDVAEASRLISVALECGRESLTGAELMQIRMLQSALKDAPARNAEQHAVITRILLEVYRAIPASRDMQNKARVLIEFTPSEELALYQIVRGLLNVSDPKKL